MSLFPPAGLKEDSSQHAVKTHDPAVSVEVDGGYEVTRPRFTRKPPLIFTTGFTDLTEAEKALVLNFWQDYFGGSNAFTWTNPVTSVEHTVRFKGEIDFKYTGMGGTHRWDCKVTLKTV